MQRRTCRSVLWACMMLFTDCHANVLNRATEFIQATWILVLSHIPPCHAWFFLQIAMLPPQLGLTAATDFPCISSFFPAHCAGGARVARDPLWPPFPSPLRLLCAISSYPGESLAILATLSVPQLKEGGDIWTIWRMLPVWHPNYL